MKSLIAVILATAVAACGGAAGTGGQGKGNPVSVDFYGALPFNSLTGATIDVFSNAAGTTQVGATIPVPNCTQPVGPSTASCFDPGLAIGNFAGAAGPSVSTTLTAAVSSGTAIAVASTAGFVQWENVTIGAYTTTAEVVQVASITDGTHFVASKAIAKAHAASDPVVTSFRPAKFFGYSLQLPGSAAPGTDYWITVKYFNGGTQVGINSLQNVKVISGKVNTLTLTANNTYTSANGVVITASSGFVTYLGLSSTQAMSVTAVDPSGGTLSYAWTATSCGGAAFDTPAAASANLASTATAASACVAKVSVSSSNAIPTASKQTTINIANDTTIVVNLPPPQINQIVLTSGNSADVACTLTRAAPGCTANACWPNVSCPQSFALPTSALNKDNAYDPQSYFMNVAVQAALGGSGFNPSAPPAVSATVDCANDLTDFPRDPTSGKPTKTFSFNPGYAYPITGTPTVNANDFATDGFFLEPTFTFGKGNWNETVTYAAGNFVVAYGFIWSSIAGGNTGNDPAETKGVDWTQGAPAGTIPVANQGAWVANASASPVGWCTVTVKVTNQSGGSDSVPVGVYFQ